MKENAVTFAFGRANRAFADSDHEGDQSDALFNLIEKLKEFGADDDVLQAAYSIFEDAEAGEVADAEIQTRLLALNADYRAHVDEYAEHYEENTDPTADPAANADRHLIEAEQSLLTAQHYVGTITAVAGADPDEADRILAIRVSSRLRIAEALAQIKITRQRVNSAGRG